MIAFSYKNLRTLARTIPLCPKPKAVGLENIPNNGPIIYVYNHITRRGEPFYLGMAAPTKPNIRFLAETVLANREYYPKLSREVEDAVFPPKFQKKAQKRLWIKPWYRMVVQILTKYVIAQAKKLNVIHVDLFEPTSEEDRLRKRKITKRPIWSVFEALKTTCRLPLHPAEDALIRQLIILSTRRSFPL